MSQLTNQDALSVELGIDKIITRLIELQESSTEKFKSPEDHRAFWQNMDNITGAIIVMMSLMCGNVPGLPRREIQRKGASQ